MNPDDRPVLFLIGMRVDDLPVPLSISLTRDCFGCSRPSWVSYATLADIGDRPFLLLCVECAVIAAQYDPSFEIEKPGEATIDAVRRMNTYTKEDIVH